MSTPARVNLATDYEPSGEEQREACTLRNNARRLAAWHLKKAARVYAVMHRRPTPVAVLLSEVPIHVGC